MDTGNPFHLKHPLGEQVTLSAIYFIYRSSEKGAGSAKMDRLNGREIEEGTE
jgi:hypothetical protein